MAGLDLRPDDFEWATQRLCAAARCPVVSVLEGGYGAWDDAAGAYDRASLARGCAAHARALIAHARQWRSDAAADRSARRGAPSPM